MKIDNDQSRIGFPKRLLLLDLDGVLLDSRENMRQSWRQVCERLGVTVGFNSYFAEIGIPFARIMDRLGLAEQAEEIESVFRIASMENLDLARFYPDVIETLSEIGSAGINMGIVTSKDKLRTNAILAMLPITFACVRTPDPAMRGKPAPDHLLAAMAEVGADPAETLYIGDMDADHEAAVRARIDYAHAAWGYGKPPEDESTILSELRDLNELVLGPDRRQRQSQ